MSAARLAALFLCLFLPVQMAAQDVTLLSRDGSIEVSGNFLSFDGEFYRVDTEMGVLTVDSSGVRCEGPGCPDLDGYFAQIRLSGDPTGAREVIPALITAFAARNGYTVEEHPDQDSVLFQLRDGDLTVGEFQVDSTSSAEGFADLVSENTDIVVSLRKVSLHEREIVREAGLGDLADPLRARVIALDALVPIVSRSNPIETLSLADLGQLYDGTIANWSQLGGPDAPVIRHLMSDDMGPESEFRRMVPMDLPEGDMTRHKSYESLVTAVESDPYALGLSRLSTGGAVHRVALTGGCGFVAEATAVDIKAEDYPFTRPVFLYTPARRLPTLAREFLRYTVSPAAQVVVARTRFVDQSVEELSFRAQGQRFANGISRAGDEVSLEDLQSATAALQGAKRLTLGFRFEGGSTALDAQSRSNVHLLAELIEAGLYDSKELIFAGFSDGDGTASVNKTLSRRRANVLRLAIERAMGEAFDPDAVTFTVTGFGEVMPLACDDVAWGRSLNRRVEIWVRAQR